VPGLYYWIVGIESDLPIVPQIPGRSALDPLFVAGYRRCRGYSRKLCLSPPSLRSACSVTARSLKSFRACPLISEAAFRGRLSDRSRCAGVDAKEHSTVKVELWHGGATRVSDPDPVLLRYNIAGGSKGLETRIACNGVELMKTPAQVLAIRPVAVRTRVMYRHGRLAGIVGGQGVVVVCC
jgi:hypothetical protein